MNIQFEKVGNVTVIRHLDARMDAVSAPEFTKQVKQHIDAGNRRLVLDMNRVNFVDSSSLGAIVGVFKAIAPNGKLILASVSGVVKDLFEITRVDQVIKVVDTEKEAIELAK
ncbi:MAG: anti-sigma B factor antagonist [Arenicella sp.]|jgi:anti-sigma B factor antagonist